ncbi:hypothetical protein X971_4982 (plasmid) [Agrobacterium tumefaciens LBA4213 (Ach5)]|nr:hypothetical protein X971_4982 [Agrobacterium tumefaciens LBA4213 (Ach5)]
MNVACITIPQVGLIRGGMANRTLIFQILVSPCARLGMKKL